MTITPESIIWYPGVYHAREGDYAKKVNDVPHSDIVVLVQKRAEEDGEWAIANDLVGDNEDKMRRMMAFVADPTNIAQCLAHILKEQMERQRTVDWVCRELANASKWMIR